MKSSLSNSTKPQIHHAIRNRRTLLALCLFGGSFLGSHFDCAVVAAVAVGLEISTKSGGLSPKVLALSDWSGRHPNLARGFCSGTPRQAGTSSCSLNLSIGLKRFAMEDWRDG
jgi:hypothetical protein